MNTYIVAVEEHKKIIYEIIASSEEDARGSITCENFGLPRKTYIGKTIDEIKLSQKVYSVILDKEGNDLGY
jgi:hypothetical protein